MKVRGEGDMNGEGRLVKVNEVGGEGKEGKLIIEG